MTAHWDAGRYPPLVSIEDHSRNGTWVNGVALPPGRPMVLSHGDRIQLILTVSPLAEVAYTYEEAAPHPTRMRSRAFEDSPERAGVYHGAAGFHLPRPLMPSPSSPPSAATTVRDARSTQHSSEGGPEPPLPRSPDRRHLTREGGGATQRNNRRRMHRAPMVAPLMLSSVGPNSSANWSDSDDSDLESQRASPTTTPRHNTRGANLGPGSPTSHRAPPLQVPAVAAAAAAAAAVYSREGTQPNSPRDAACTTACTTSISHIAFAAAEMEESASLGASSCGSCSFSYMSRGPLNAASDEAGSGLPAQHSAPVPPAAERAPSLGRAASLRASTNRPRRPSRLLRVTTPLSPALTASGSPVGQDDTSGGSSAMSSLGLRLRNRNPSRRRTLYGEGMDTPASAASSAISTPRASRPRATALNRSGASDVAASAAGTAASANGTPRRGAAAWEEQVSCDSPRRGSGRAPYTPRSLLRHLDARLAPLLAERSSAPAAVDQAWSLSEHSRFSSNASEAGSGAASSLSSAREAVGDAVALGGGGGSAGADGEHGGPYVVSVMPDVDVCAHAAELPSRWSLMDADCYAEVAVSLPPYDGRTAVAHARVRESLAPANAASEERPPAAAEPQAAAPAHVDLHLAGLPGLPALRTLPPPQDAALDVDAVLAACDGRNGGTTGNIPSTSRYAASLGLTELLCGVCGDYMTQAVAVQPCGHTFCASCLSEHLEGALLGGSRMGCPERCTAFAAIVPNDAARRLEQLLLGRAQRRERDVSCGSPWMHSPGCSPFQTSPSAAFAAAGLSPGSGEDMLQHAPGACPAMNSARVREWRFGSDPGPIASAQNIHSQGATARSTPPRASGRQGPGASDNASGRQHQQQRGNTRVLQGDGSPAPSSGRRTSVQPPSVRSSNDALGHGATPLCPLYDEFLPLPAVRLHIRQAEELLLRLRGLLEAIGAAEKGAEADGADGARMQSPAARARCAELLGPLARLSAEHPEVAAAMTAMGAAQGYLIAARWLLRPLLADLDGGETAAATDGGSTDGAARDPFEGRTGAMLALRAVCTALAPLLTPPPQASASGWPDEQRHLNEQLRQQQQQQQWSVARLGGAEVLLELLHACAGVGQARGASPPQQGAVITERGTAHELLAVSALNVLQLLSSGNLMAQAHIADNGLDAVVAVLRDLPHSAGVQAAGLQVLAAVAAGTDATHAAIRHRLLEEGALGAAASALAAAVNGRDSCCSDDPEVLEAAMGLLEVMVAAPLPSSAGRVLAKALRQQGVLALLRRVVQQEAALHTDKGSGGVRSEQQAKVLAQGLRLEGSIARILRNPWWPFNSTFAAGERRLGAAEAKQSGWSAVTAAAAGGFLAGASVTAMLAAAVACT